MYSKFQKPVWSKKWYVSETMLLVRKQTAVSISYCNVEEG